MKRFCLVFLFSVSLTLATCAPPSRETVAPPEVEPKPTIEVPATPSNGEMVGFSEIELQATLEIPATLSSGEPVMLTFTLTNNADTDLYVLKWYTPLEGIAGEIFQVTRDGQSIPYEGVLAMRGNPIPENYVLLKAGESVSNAVDLAQAYDFSQPGDYTIRFLSPRISHVATSESELATTVNELGPVSMPSDPVSFRIVSTALEPGRRTLAEASDRLHAYLLSQKPNLAPDTPLPLEDLPLPSLWDSLQAQLFRVTDGPFTRESYLMVGDTVLPLGTAIGGQGLTSAVVGDVDGDGADELVFVYSFGSGIHQSHIGMYAPALDDSRTYDAVQVYLGDLGLFQDEGGGVSVEVVKANDATKTLNYGEVLGRLAIEHQDGEINLTLHLNEDLSDEERQKIVSTSE